MFPKGSIVDLRDSERPRLTPRFHNTDLRTEPVHRVTSLGVSQSTSLSLLLVHPIGLWGSNSGTDPVPRTASEDVLSHSSVPTKKGDVDPSGSVGRGNLKVEGLNRVREGLFCRDNICMFELNPAPSVRERIQVGRFN